MDRMQLRLVVSGRPWTCSIFLACTFLCVAACEVPDFRYRPVGWEESGGEWVWRGRSFDVRMTEPGGFVSSDGMIPEVDVRNRGDATVVFQACTLTTKGRRYSSSSLPRWDLRYRTVKPGSMLRLPIYFSFEDALFKIMGESFDLDLQYDVGNEGRNLHIHFVRDR